MRRGPNAHLSIWVKIIEWTRELNVSMPHARGAELTVSADSRTLRRRLLSVPGAGSSGVTCGTIAGVKTHQAELKSPSTCPHIQASYSFFNRKKKIYISRHVGCVLKQFQLQAVSKCQAHTLGQRTKNPFFHSEKNIHRSQLPTCCNPENAPYKCHHVNPLDKARCTVIPL